MKMNYKNIGNLPVELRSKRMKKILGTDRDDSHLGGKVLNLIPNVSKFKVEITGGDIVYALFGIDKRTPPRIKFEIHTNKPMNRYIIHQFKRMDSLSRTNPLACGRIGMHLIRKSNVFFVMALNHVFPKGHRNMKLSSAIRLAIQVRRIANTPESKLDFGRVYIPKSNGKGRPLGVPTPAGRIYLHMMNTILTFYLESSGQFHDSQHGFRPGRGTMSAGRVILNDVINSKDIYEFDLKGYFDSINLDYISNVLIKMRVPSNIVQLLYYINTCACTVKPPYKLNEFEHMMKALIHKKSTFSEVVKAPRPLSYMYRVRGVPQGAPTSPVLSSLALHNSILDRGMKTVMYADDGIYYGDIQQPIITPNSGMVTANIRFNLDKSEGVKKDGKGLKPLKFLGLEYDGEANVLRASTRKGSKLVYDKENLVQAINELNSEFSKMTLLERQEMKAKYSWGRSIRNNNTWEDLIKSNLLGFIQSRLYQGDWNLEGYEQTFDLTYKKQSYIEKYSTALTERINVFNSTTFSSEGLVKKLSTIKTLKTL